MLSAIRETIQAQPDNWTEVFSPKEVVDFFKRHNGFDLFASLSEPLKAEFAQNAGVRALFQEIAHAVKNSEK